MLNKSQKKAVECLKNPCIVIAGPGTGKTALITEKIKFLIEKKTKPEEILALTFTNKAAEEMTQRVQNPEFCAHTFHSFALELIKEYQKHITKIDKNFRIIDDANIQLYFIENLEYFKLQSVELGNNIASTAQDLANTITKIKDFGLTIQDIEKLELESKLKTDLITSYANYEGFKKKKNLIDYADILLYIKDLLEKKPEIKIELQNRYKYILIDEFQDTNKLQFEIIKLLSKKDNITIVGDQKQSIYSFRGSNYENLELFKKHFKNHEEIFLNENYRSSKQVLEITNKLITNKKELLKPTKIEEGNIELIEACDEQSQIQYLIENLENLKEEKVGILTRTKTDAQKISKKLNEFGIKHILEGATNIFNQNEIKEIIFYIQIALHPKESNAEIFHILSNSGLRKETVRKITRKASLKERSISNVLESEENLSDFKDEQELAKEIREKILYFINLKKTSIPIKQFALEIIEKTNIYKNAIIEDDKQKIQNLNLFLGFIDNYNEVYQISDLDHFLKICNLTKKIDIETTYDENLNSNIEILTIHASKGKEFDHVFIPNLNKRKFPLSNKPSKFEINLNKENHEDEEKRLFFVAVSRAKKELHLSYVKKYIDNKFPSPPSEFVQTLKLKPQEYNKKLLTLNLSKREQKEVESINKIVTLLLNSNYELAKTEIDKMKSGFVKKDLISYFNKKKNEEIENDDKKLLSEKMVYSVSQIQTYKSCPKKYMYQYIYKIPTQSRHYFSFGTSVHEVLEHMAKTIGQQPKEMLYASSIAKLHNSWISQGYESHIQEKEYFNKGIEALRDFIETQTELIKDKREIVGTEQTFTLELEGKKIYGIIDRIDKIGNDYEILDYKTSNSMESEQNLKKNIQLYVYALAIKELKGKFPEKVALWYLIHDKIKYVKIDLHNIEEIKKEILGIISEIEKGVFNPTPSFFACKFCDFNKICPESKEN